MKLPTLWRWRQPRFEKDIHVTDVLQFSKCRRAWDWGSMLRRGLQPAEMPEPLFVGLGVHIGLEHGYAQGGSFNLEAAQQALYDWVKKRTTRMKETSGALWEQEKDDIRARYTLASSLLLHYSLWTVPYDERYEVIATEQKYRVAIPHTPYTLAGRYDGILKDRVTGDLYVLEYKTTGRLDYLRWVMRGLQGTVYVWSARQSFENVKGIAYRILVKKVPKDPRVLASGHLSKAKKQNTTYEWYLHYLHQIAVENNIEPQVLEDEVAPVLNELRNTENKYIQQHLISKTPAQFHAALTDLRCNAREMAKLDVPIFPRYGYYCKWCSFLDACNLKDVGADWEGILEAEYAPRRYWEDET